jgi:hypothetical protein
MVKSNLPILKKNVYRPRLLEKPIVVNDRVIRMAVISSYYEIKHSKYMNDELIMLLVKKLDGDFFIPKPKAISKGN